MLHRGWDRRSIILLTFALLFVIDLNIARTQVLDLEWDHAQMMK